MQCNSLRQDIMLLGIFAHCFILDITLLPYIRRNVIVESEKQVTALGEMK